MEKSNQSQEQRILAFLRSGRSLTPAAALARFGSFRLASRIFSIKKKLVGGEHIINIGETKNGKTYARYKLKKM